ncbi:MAG: PKD domain-containing protein [Flavobacteriales bacterium]|nr:PKD domain-containing protein [Flavobacteriales bacterium]
MIEKFKYSLVVIIILLVVILLGMQSTMAQSISASSRNTCFICEDNGFGSSGNNNYAQYGNASINITNQATIFDTLDQVKIRNGSDHYLGLSQNHQVFSWGYNQRGQLGHGNTTVFEDRQQVTGLSNIIDIACGDMSSYAVNASGQVYAWGANGSFQLGLGDNVNRSNANLVNLSNVSRISAGQNHALALLNSGQVMAWGANQFGQCGGEEKIVKSPQKIEDLTDIIALSSGSHHSIALDQNGYVKSWGKNSTGQLGLGDKNNNSSPTLIAGLSNIISIQSGSLHNLALDENGDVWAWGLNHVGQLGVGGSEELSPILISALDSVFIVEIIAGPFSSFAIDSSGSVYAWGMNDEGQLGLGNNVDQYTPALLTLPCQIKSSNQNNCTTQAEFNISDSIICISDTLAIQDLSSNAQSIKWYSNEQFIGTSGQLSLNFQTEGTYIIDLIANPEGACADTMSKLIQVAPIPSASIYNIGSFCELDSVVALQVDADSGVWSGNGVSGAYFNPNAAGVGTHEVVFVAFNEACSNSDTNYIQVHGNPNVSVVGPSDLCYGVSSTLYAQGGLSYVWNQTHFGDSLVISSNQDTSIQVLAVDYNGCSDETTILLNVDSVPQAQYAFQVLNDTVQFNNLSNDANQWYWDFGDGNSSVLEHPEHIYTPGQYSVTLISSNHCGSDTLVQTVQVGTVTGINQTSNVTIEIYPNPATDFVNVSGAQGTLKIVNTLGQVVHQQMITTDLISIDVSDLSKGQYLLQFDNGDSQELVVY